MPNNSKANPKRMRFDFMRAIFLSGKCYQKAG
jgi:hypothetical protein